MRKRELTQLMREKHIIEDFEGILVFSADFSSILKVS